MELATVRREVALRWICRQHEGFFENGIRHYFGGLGDFRSIARRTPSIYNSWTSFLRMMRGMPNELSSIWSLTRSATKDTIRDDIACENTAHKEERSADIKKVTQCPIVGPFGGIEYAMPFNVDHVYEEVNRQGSQLREHWKGDNINRFREYLEQTKPAYIPSVRSVKDSENVVLEGENVYHAEKIGGIYRIDSQT